MMLTFIRIDKWLGGKGSSLPGLVNLEDLNARDLIQPVESKPDLGGGKEDDSSSQT